MLIHKRVVVSKFIKYTLNKLIKCVYIQPAPTHIFVNTL